MTKSTQGDTVSFDATDLAGDLFLEVNGEKLPLERAFDTDVIPTLKLGGALAQLSSKQPSRAKSA